MKNCHIYVNVYLGDYGFVNCGVITYNKNSDYSAFSYFEDYISKGFPSINPATLNYNKNNSRHFILNKRDENELLDKTFWELIPNENDWGDQVLSAEYTEYDNLIKVEKLHYLKSRQVGGLESFSDLPEDEMNIKSLNLLDRLRDDSINFYLRNIDKISYIKEIKPLTGYGGIRPKCMFEDSGGEFWIAKFNLPSDSYNMAKFEKTTLDIAKDSGLEIAQSELFTLPSGEEIFISKRFDRDKIQRNHSLSFFALMDKSEIKKGEFKGNPGTYVKQLLDRYSDFKDKDTHRLVHKYLIDIALNNTDNHLRNIRMILNNQNKWELSPQFDIVANQFEQNHIYNPLEINNEDMFILNPDLPIIFEKKYGINSNTVKKIIDKIINCVENWETYCDKNNMSYEDKVKFCSAINIGMSKKNQNNFKPKPKVQINHEHLPKLKPKNS